MINRAGTWLKYLVTSAECLTAHQENGVAWCDALLDGKPVRYIAVVSDPANPFPRARNGEVGLLQGWTLAACVREVIDDIAHAQARGIISLIDVPSQAYGRKEEALCISLALAAAVDAYASARLGGHPTVGLIVGRAFSGALLAHGYQAASLLALSAEDVQIHAMGKESAARITRRTVEALEQATRGIYPAAYDLESFTHLGILDDLIPCSNPDKPTEQDVALVLGSLTSAMQSVRQTEPLLAPRLGRSGDGNCRDLSRQVRAQMQMQWTKPRPESTQ